MPRRPRQGDLISGSSPARRYHDHSTKPQGYAAPPGTGPEGQTCGSCKHCCFKQLRRRFYKCRLMARTWTWGRGTDINLSSPACKRWEAGSPTPTGIV